MIKTLKYFVMSGLSVAIDYGTPLHVNQPAASVTRKFYGTNLLRKSTIIGLRPQIIISTYILIFPLLRSAKEPVSACALLGLKLTLINLTHS